MGLMDVPMVESLAVMGLINPFFELFQDFNDNSMNAELINIRHCINRNI